MKYFEIKRICTDEIKEKLDYESFENLLNNNLDLSDYGTGLTNIDFTFVGLSPTDQPQKNEASYDPIQKQLSLKFNLNHYQLKMGTKNDASKMMATLFLNSTSIYEQLDVPEFKKGKFYNDLEGLFFRRGLLLFDE